MSIILDKVSCIYDEGTPQQRFALKCVSAVISPGEFIGIIGKTGSGKSTFMQLLNGILKPSGGSVYFEGEDIHGQDYDLKKLRKKIGLAFQYPEDQLFETTVFRDVCFGPKNLGWSRKEIELSAFDALYQMGVPQELYYQPPFLLSGGQKRRVAIAGVLAMKPDVLILDEPTAGLDPCGRHEILNLIAKLHREKNCTILLASHSMEDIAEYVNRIMALHQGSLVMDGTVEQIFSRTEELEKIGLAAPQVSYLARALRQEGIPISQNITTIEQAKTELLKLFQ